MTQNEVNLSIFDLLKKVGENFNELMPGSGDDLIRESIHFKEAIETGEEFNGGKGK